MTMKKILNMAGAAALAVMALAACSPESFDGMDKAGLPLVANYEKNVHVDVDQATNTATFSFDAVDGVTPLWIIDGKQYSSNYKESKYYRKAGDYSVDFQVKNANGISDGKITKTFHIDKTVINGFGGFVEDSEFNMWKTATVADPTFYYAPGWSQVADPQYTKSGRDYSVTLPSATSERWQAQMMLNTNISTSSDKSYDFSVILTSQKGHPGVMVKLVDPTDANKFYFAEATSLEAGEPKCFYMSAMPGLDISNLQLVLDFGGNAENDVVNVESIVLKDHANDDGTVVPNKPTEQEPVWVALNSPDNLWHGAKFETGFYYAPGWSQIADPKMSVDGDVYSFSLPQATTDQWQAQVLFKTNIATDADTPYDFCITLNASNDVKGATVKLVQSDEGDTKHDDNYYFVKQADLAAGADTKVWVSNVKPLKGAMQAVTLVLDFGGNPAKTDVTVSKIIMQKHRN